MILVDVNLLLYGTVAGYPQHDAARAWLEERFNGPAGVGLPWVSLLGFVRLASNPRVLENPMPVRRAWGRVEEWLGLEATFVPEPAARHSAILRELIPSAGNRSNLVPDVYLAALAIEYGLTLCSTDADFARFPGLSWEDPLSRRGAAPSRPR